jgi:hypothetical protein
VADDHDSIPHLIVDAARIVAPVFKDEGWMYLRREGEGPAYMQVPTEADLAEMIQRVIGECQGEWCERGRILARRIKPEWGGEVLSVYLNLGDIQLVSEAVAG